MSSFSNCCNTAVELYFELPSLPSSSWAEDEEDEQDHKVNLKQGFCTVFEHGIELKQVKSKSDEEKDYEEFGMCVQCNSALAALYKSYLQFMRLTKLGSAVRSMIAESSLWEINKDENRHQIHDDDYHLENLINFDTDEHELQNSIVIKEEVEEEQFPFHDINCFSAPPKFEFDDIENEFISVSRASKFPIVLIQKLSPKDIESEVKKIKSSSGSRLRQSCKTKSKSKPPTAPKKKRSISSFHEGQIIYSCTSCPATFPNFYKYRKHRQLFHTSSIRKTYPCHGCSIAPFFKSGDLASHLVTVHNIGHKLPEQQCPSCPMYFPSRPRMRAHFRYQHLDKGKFPCSVEGCKATASNQAALRVHVRLVHQTTSKAHMCEVCGATYKSESGLKLHVRRNHVENPPSFTCNICSKNCTTSVGLKDHMTRVHSEGRVRNVACEQCPKLFYDIGELKKHKRNVHTGLGPKPHVCETCGARFAQKVGLRHHYLANHAEGYGPFPCPICGKEFKAKDNLKQHLGTKVHGEEGKLLLEQQRSDQKQPRKQGNASSPKLFVNSDKEERPQAENEMEFHLL